MALPVSEAEHPTVSVIVAAYGRPEVLRWAIKSVLAQTRTDWELIIVADACPATTRLMSSGVYDVEPRIRFYNLSSNHGDQSGPNNYGIARARGRFIAFLNQDDLWFPDHLALCLDRLDAVGADLVFSITGSMVGRSAVELADGDWLGGLLGISRDGSYDPVHLFAPASSWVFRKDIVPRLGHWKSAAECLAAPSQEFLYRAWREGFRLRSCPMLTVLQFSSGGRSASYLEDMSHEQDWWLNKSGLTPRSRAMLWNRLSYHPPDPRRPGIKTALLGAANAALSVAARLGIEPQGLKYFITQGYRKGDFMNSLRRTRGLEPMAVHGREASRDRLRSVRGACQYAWGTRIDFSRRGDAQTYQVEGWAFPEEWGTWTEGPQASLVFILGALPREAVLHLEAQALLAEAWRRQRVVLSAGEVELACLVWSEGGFATVEVALPPAILSPGGLLTLTFRLLDCISPERLGLSSDRRSLGVGIKVVSINALRNAFTDDAGKLPFAAAAENLC